MGHLQEAIKSLNIQFKLVQYLPIDNSEKYSQLVRIQVDIARKYLLLGYTGKSGIAFAEAQKYFTKTKSMDATSWKVPYILYFLSIGKLDKW
jgi:hypothetical protein